jgi:type IV pilus assembly protein PilX
VKASMNARSYRRQRGVVLFLAMIFLVLLTILAVTASSTSVMQERMTGGMRNLQLGLMGAESTVRGGEDVLWSIQFDAGSPLPPCISGSDGSDCVYKPNPDGTLLPIVQRFRSSREWLDPATDGARAYPRALTGLTGSGETASLAEQPRFMIEYLGAASGPFKQSGAKNSQKGGAKAGEHASYRITARSQGGTDAVVRVAESYFSTMNLTNIGANPEPAP